MAHLQQNNIEARTPSQRGAASRRTSCPAIPVFQQRHEKKTCSASREALVRIARVGLKPRINPCHMLRFQHSRQALVHLPSRLSSALSFVGILCFVDTLPLSSLSRWFHPNTILFSLALPCQSCRPRQRVRAMKAIAATGIAQLASAQWVQKIPKVSQKRLG